MSEDGRRQVEQAFAGEPPIEGLRRVTMPAIFTALHPQPLSDPLPADDVDAEA